jgi:hypothetical protein
MMLPLKNRRSFLFPALAICMGVLAAVTIAELAGRVADGLAENREGNYVPDPELGFTARDREYFKHRKDQKAYVPGRQAKIFRVFALGDSFVKPRGEMTNDQVFFRLVETYVERKLGDPSLVEFFHFGLSGYSQIQEGVLLRKFLPAYHPALVIIQVYVGNDVAENAGIIQRALSRGQISAKNPAGVVSGNPVVGSTTVVRIEYLITSTKQWLALHSYVYRVASAMKHTLIARRAAADRYSLELQGHASLKLDVGDDGSKDPVATNLHVFDLLSPARQAALADAWRITAELTGQIRDVCRKADANLLFVLIPQRVQVLDDLWRRSLHEYHLAESMFDRDLPNRRWVELLRAGSVEVLDLLPVYRAAHARGENPYEPGGHIGKEGHAVTAEAIIQILDRLGWLPPALSSNGRRSA